MLGQLHSPMNGTYISTVNPKGRLTLPVQVRKILNIAPDDKILFRVEDGAVSIEGKLPTLEELAGSVTPCEPQKTLDTVIREAKKEHYDKRIAKLAQQ